MRPVAAQLEREATGKTFRQMLLAVPGVDARQIDVLPTQRRDVPEQMIRNLATRVA
jgi:hypothetical protein